MSLENKMQESISTEILKELEKLRIENKKLKNRVRLYEKTIERTNSIVFIYDYYSEKILWSSENPSFKELLGEDWMMSLNIHSKNFLQNIHESDKSLFLLKSIYFKENINNKNNLLTLLFRHKFKEDEYNWMYLKVCHYSETENMENQRCLCFLTLFNDNIISTNQINELSKYYLKEKYREVINKLNEEEKLIVKLIAKGKTRKEIQDQIGIKSLSHLNNKIDKIFHKTNVANSAALSNLFSDFGFF